MRGKPSGSCNAKSSSIEARFHKHKDLEPRREPTRSLRRLGEDCTDGQSTSQGVEGVPRCWALLWGTKITWPDIWKQWRTSNASCWSAYLGSKTCRVHGCCCCTVHQHGELKGPFSVPKRHVRIRRMMKVRVPLFHSASGSSTARHCPRNCNSAVISGRGGPQCIQNAHTCILGRTDCLGMIRQRHPDVAAQLVLHREGHPHTPRPVQQGPSEESRDLNLHRGKLSRMV